VVGEDDDPRVLSLRARGVSAVAERDRATALAWARGWGFTHVVDGATLIEVESLAEREAAPLLNGVEGA
jgi:hypothetical protein